MEEGQEVEEASIVKILDSEETEAYMTTSCSFLQTLIHGPSMLYYTWPGKVMEACRQSITHAIFQSSESLGVA